MIVTDIVVGSLCYRKFDNTYSLQNQILVKSGGSVNNSVTIYE